MIKIRALILAAGRGSRMGRETALKPKCLIELKGKTLLSWQLKSLKESSLSDITVVRGYRADMLTGNFSTVDNKRWNETNMVASLFSVPSFKGETLISYSDIVYNPEHVRNLLLSEHDITITADVLWKDLWSLRFDNPLDDAETFKHKDGELYEIGKKTKDYSDIQAQYMGLLKLTEKGWTIMEDLYNSLTQVQQDKMDMTSMLNLLIENNIPIRVQFIEGKWCEVDNYEDKLAYEDELENNSDWQHDWR